MPTPLNSAFTQQYALVQSARTALLGYCASFGPEHFVAPVATFHQGSIRDLLVHVAGCYDYWLGEVGRRRPAENPAPASVPDVPALRAVFAEVDGLVAEFNRHFAASWLTPAAFVLPRRPEPLLLSPLQLFTHAIAHEFHHKGQVLSMSRQLGYSPVDTDVIRF